MLHSQVAQQCLKSVDEAFSGFFKLLGMKKEGKLAARISLPHYLKKDGYFPLVYPQPYIKAGKIQFSVSNKFRKNYREQTGKVFKAFKFSIPPILTGKKIHEFRIISKYNGRYFVAQFVYEIKEEKAENLDKDQCLSLDLGLNNLVAAIDTKGSSFLVDGRKLKSINQGWKMRINIGKVNNQNFVQIPFHPLRQQLTYLCKRYGINYIKQEESYTSLASALDLDNLPEYNADNPQTYEFSGKRIKRGLYWTKDEKLVNSDINGSANIGRKSKANVFEKREVLEGQMARSKRILYRVKNPPAKHRLCLTALRWGSSTIIFLNQY